MYIRDIWCKSIKTLKNLFLNLEHSFIFAIVKAKHFEKWFCKIIFTNFYSDIDPMFVQSNCKHKPQEIYLKSSPSIVLSFSLAMPVLRSKIKNLQNQILTVHLILLLAKRERERGKIKQNNNNKNPKPTTNLQVTSADCITEYCTKKSSFSI